MTATHTVHIEDDYSSFYKAQLRLIIHDDFGSIEGSFHVYADHIHRKLAIAKDRGLLGEYQEHWFYRDDETQPPFRGANLRTFFKNNSDPDLVIWKVFDLYIKYTKPLLAGACKLEGYLERLGLTLSEFVHPVQSGQPPALKHSGLFSCDLTEHSKLYLDIQTLTDRRFALAHLVHVGTQDTAITIEGFKDHRTRIDKGVCIPQTNNDLIVIRDIESADVSFGFIQKKGDDICCHRILLDGSVQAHIFKPSDDEAIRKMIKAASFNEEV